MQIKYGDLEIKTDKNDVDNLIKIKDSLTPGEKIVITILGFTIIITAGICLTSYTIKANKILEEKNIIRENDIHENR